MMSIFNGSLSPDYVKNPYLRAKFVEVLLHWLPGDPEEPRRWNPRMASLFEVGRVIHAEPRHAPHTVPVLAKSSTT